MASIGFLIGGALVNALAFTGSNYLYCLTKISIRAKRSISRVFSLFIVPSPLFCTLPVQRPY